MRIIRIIDECSVVPETGMGRAIRRLREHREMAISEAEAPQGAGSHSMIVTRPNFHSFEH